MLSVFIGRLYIVYATRSIVHFGDCSEIYSPSPYSFLLIVHFLKQIKINNSGIALSDESILRPKIR